MAKSKKGGNTKLLFLVCACALSLVAFILLLATPSLKYTYTGALSSSIFSRIFVPSSLYEEYVSKMGSLSYLLSYEGEMP